jgi:hypothetical protein
MNKARLTSGIWIIGMALMVLVHSNGYSQTLQFSQVLLIGSNTQTVPAGKVWKVETVLPEGQGVTSLSRTPLFITVNANSVGIGGFSNYGSTLDIHSQPVWLPAGTTIAAGQNVFRVSVIEFTVVP